MSDDDINTITHFSSIKSDINTNNIIDDIIQDLPSSKLGTKE